MPWKLLNLWYVCAMKIKLLFKKITARVVNKYEKQLIVYENPFIWYVKKFKREKDITGVEFESTVTIQGVS